jgi:hypothetical protein
MKLNLEHLHVTSFPTGAPTAVVAAIGANEASYPHICYTTTTGTGVV